MANRAGPRKTADTLLVTVAILASLASPAAADTANEPSTMTVEEFLSLARRHVPLPEREYGIEYEYLVVEGTVEDIRFSLRTPADNREEARAFNIGRVGVARMHAAPVRLDDEVAAVDIALVHVPYHSREGYNVFRSRGGGGDYFDRWQIGDYIVAVAIRTSHPTLHEVEYSGDEHYTNVLCVVRQGDANESEFAVITGSAFLGEHKKPFDHQSTPWTMVDPSTYTRDFVSVSMRAEEVFDSLVALVDAAAAR